MKIRIAICTTDTQYEKRLTQYFQVHYYDKFVWNVFTQTEYLKEFLKNEGADIVLVDEEVKSQQETEKWEEKGDFIFAWLVEELKEDEKQEQILKYAKGDTIYRQLLELYSRKKSIHFQNTAAVSGKTEICAFISPAGGVGTSTIACAAAIHAAALEKVLYLNLETISASALIFAEEGQKGFDELLFAMKSRRKALELKLVGTVRQDKSGVCFFENTKNILDMLELTQGDLKELLSAIEQTKEYDKVFLDVGNGLGEKEVAAMMYANRLNLIVDDSENTRLKLDRYLDTLHLIEEKNQTDIASKIRIFYNKVMKQQTLPEQLADLRVSGAFPKIENGTYEGITGKIAGLEITCKVY